uniref:Uncharacterized protein n=1 Tax=viral metagenome TaxID=1070528 RepID=A0A6M3KBW2_9ZZZZ
MKAQNEISRTVPGDGNYVIGPYNVQKTRLRHLSNAYDFAQFPVIWDGTQIVHRYPDGLQFAFHDKGIQTLREPAVAATGMDYAYDQTSDDGWEWCLEPVTTKGIEGITKFTVGAAAFYAKLRFSIADVSGTDDCAFGFRKVEAFQANLDDYDEMATLNVISGNITIETIINAATTVTTDTTDDWANLGIHTLEVYVSKAGAVTYKIDGVVPTTTKAFSFDTSEVVTPFMFFLNAADLADSLILEELEYGLQ